MANFGQLIVPTSIPSSGIRRGQPVFFESPIRHRKGFALSDRVEAEGQIVSAFEFLAFCNGGFVMKREEALEKVDGALAELEQALANGDSETLKAYLAFLGKFHNYSFGNLILIFMQCPHASHVAGFNGWKKLKRHVKKGETGIRILAPVIYKKEDSEAKEQESGEEAKKRKLVAFKVVSVFDVSQTDGEDLPSIRGYSGDPAENLQTLELFATDKSITVVWQRPDTGALGISKGGLIEVDPELESADRFAVLVHEVAHELLHRGERREKTNKTMRETEAEAVAFAVCSAVGLEVGNSAADYIKLWEGNAEQLRESLDFIRVTASEILSALSTDVPAHEPVTA